MAMSVKNPDVERLVRKVVDITGETKTEAIRRALEERCRRLELEGGRVSRYERLRRLMEQEIWPRIPEEALGSTISRDEEESILGLGPEGA